VVNIFAREITDNLASLVKQVDAKAQENGDLCAFLVVLTEDSDAAAEELKKLADKHGIKKVPLTVFEGSAGPPNYKLAKDADVTVHMWVNTKVKVNHSFAKGKLDDKSVTSVVADIAKITE
jgi:predicted TIM-barrel fold metal-dependent hydrolase